MSWKKIHCPLPLLRLSILPIFSATPSHVISARKGETLNPVLLPYCVSIKHQVEGDVGDIEDFKRYRGEKRSYFLKFLMVYYCHYIVWSIRKQIIYLLIYLLIVKKDILFIRYAMTSGFLYSKYV